MNSIYKISKLKIKNYVLKIISKELVKHNISNSNKSHKNY